MTVQARVTINGLPPKQWQVKFSRKHNRLIAEKMRAALERVLLNVERAVKTRTYPASGLATRSGHLKRNIGSGPQGIREVQRPRRFGPAIRTVGLIGSRVVYAGIHEHGGQAGRGHVVTIPARPYIGPAFKHVRAAQVLSKHLQQAVDESV